jgi:iron(III) transport system ATP-binding protein
VADLKINGLSKSYDGQALALNAIDLHIAHGELVALLGPSGCGKTTTLRLVAGFLTPDSGSIEVGGNVIATPQKSSPPEKRKMSMIFQSYAIWPHKTVSENVAYGLKYQKVPRDAAQKKVREMLDIVQLGDLGGRYPAELSGGQQQRVALARALVVEPEILLLDEPLSNLDANLREEMRFEIRRLHDEFHFTSLYVTHDQSEAMLIADRICVMNGGNIEQVGTPTEIYERPRTRFTAEFVGRTNLLTGQMKGGDRFELASGMVIPVSGQTDAAQDSSIAVSLRPHDIVLSRDTHEIGSVTPEGYHCFPGVVRDCFYFGDSLDYVISIGENCELRVIKPPGDRLQPNESISVQIHPDNCVVVQQ